MTKAIEGAARRATASDAEPILSQQAGDKPKTGRIGALPITLAILLGAAPMTDAQELSIKTGNEIVTFRNTGNFVVKFDSPAAMVTGAGDVTIDWNQAEKIVAEANKWDSGTLAIARLMIAIRDGTYKTQR